MTERVLRIDFEGYTLPLGVGSKKMNRQDSKNARKIIVWGVQKKPEPHPQITQISQI
jgi:hypothetical protein